MSKFTPEIKQFIINNIHKGSKWVYNKLITEFNLNISKDSLRQFCSRNQIKVPIKRYDDEVIEYMKTIAHLRSPEIQKLIKEKFNINISTGVINYLYELHSINRANIFIKFTPEIKQFIIDNSYKGYQWLLKEVTEQFNLNTTLYSLRTYCTRNKIKVPTANQKYSEEHINFIINNNDLQLDEIVEKFNNTFDIKITKPGLLNIQHKYNIKRYTFPKILEETVRISNNRKYIAVKIAVGESHNNYIAKPRYVWMQHYGEIPKGYNVIQIDGDYTNCNIENLRCIPNKVCIKIAKTYGLGIITDAMIEIVKLENDINKTLQLMEENNNE